MAQGQGRNFDADLVIREAFDVDLGNFPGPQHLVLQVLGIGLQVRCRHRPGDRHGDDKIGTPQLRDYRVFHGFGEVVDGFDLGLDIIQKTVDVAAVVHFHAGHGNPFLGLAGDFLEVADAIDGVFDAFANGAFNFRRAGPGVGGDDLYLFRRNIGESFAFDGRDGSQADR